MSCRYSFALRLTVLTGAAAITGSITGRPAPPDLNHQFDKVVKPFADTYCMGCHSGKSPAAMFSLQPYTTMSEVVKDYGHWNTVLDKLKAGQMPPKGMKQPKAEERQAVIDWIVAMRTSEAHRNAGDPGPVLARRLSNAEYNYTIRDLTGVDMQPTKEFPVDPANTAGFDNSGESLTMSPALLNKYLLAAREVANHMALTPDGLVFAPHPMLVETDREKFAIQRIVKFYERQPTDYADYFMAAWRYKHRAALRKPAMTLAQAAKDAKISPKYLPLVREMLGETPVGKKYDEVGPILKLRTMWRALPGPGDDTELKKQCEAMRDFVLKTRKSTAMEFTAPKVRGLTPTSQPLMNWKLRQFAANRRHSDPKALRLPTDPPLVPPARIPRAGALGQEAAVRWSVILTKIRAADPDLDVPAGEKERYQAAFEKFANVFPDAFYIKERGRFYPDDTEDKGRLLSAGFHNVMGYFRDDTPLIELILDENGRKELERLWGEFEFMGDYTGRTWVQYYFNQSGEVQGNGRESGTARPSDAAVSASPIIFGLRDTYIAKAKSDPSNDPVALEAIEDHFKRVNDTLRTLERTRAAAEPKHVDALLKFTAGAWRHPLTPEERAEILDFYKTLREKNSLSHEEAIRDSVVRVLMSPKFCYRVDLTSSLSSTPTGPGRKTVPLSPYALATRLSYYLWSSMPDDQLLSHAAKGDLQRREVLLAETRRMLKDGRASALAVEFAGNWLDYRRFEDHNSVDRERFPAFTNDLREAMFQEPVHLIEDAIRNNGSVLDLIYGKQTFVNPVLAKHYGIPNVTGDNNHWTRIEDATPYGRGGLLPMAVFLTRNSPGLRTSPVKRGYWVVRRLLGEVIPPPPPNVPELPQDEAKANLPLRDMLAKHRENALCAQCHQRFDAFGLAFENYGPVGDRREKDLAGRAVDTQVDFPNGTQGSGYEGVLSYIRQNRQNDYLDNLSRMMLAYALGRSLMLSDEPAVERMTASLKANGYRFNSLIETTVTSPQFLNRRVQIDGKHQSQTD